MKHTSETLAVTSDLLLKHLENTCNICMKQLEHSKHAYETLAKKHLKTLHMFENICNIQIKTLAIYVWKQMKQFKQMLATCL
jgi:hypothetical protein